MGLKVLITGSNGFIGRVITQHLVTRGHEVHGLNRTLPRFQPYTAHNYACDIRDLENLQTIVEGYYWDAVIHAAAIIDITDGQPNDQLGYNIDMTTTNTVGTHNLLNACRGHTQSLIYLSSMGIIGRPNELPVTEQHPLNATGLYHSSKILGERIMTLGHYTEQSLFSLRIAPPVGPGMDSSKILPTFIKQALANEPLTVKGYGGRRQDYIDVRDIAHAVENVIMKRKMLGDTYNIASGRTISNLELAQKCIQHLHSQSTIIFKDNDIQENLNWDISIEKARKGLGFIPIYQIEHTIDSIVGAKLYA